MSIPLIIDISIGVLLLLFALFGFLKGTYKSTFSLIWKIFVFVLVYISFPLMAKLIFKFIPEDMLERMYEYTDANTIEDLVAGVLRVFGTAIVWIIALIILKPISAILCHIFRKLILGEKKPKKLWSRFAGMGINLVTGFLTISLLLGPFAGAFATLRDENGNTRCIVSGDFDSCKYTAYYTDSTFAKVMSTANYDKTVFRLLSTINVDGAKIVLSKDLASIVDIYFFLAEKGVDFTGEMDAVKILAGITSDDIRSLGKTVSKISLLTVLAEKIGYNILEKELDLPDTIDLSKINIKNEIQNAFNIVANAADLPIFENDEITKNYANVLSSFDDEWIDSFVDSIEESELIDQLYETYLVPKFDEMVERLIEKLGGNKAVTLNTEDITLGSELRSMLKAMAKIKNSGLVKLNSETGQYEFAAKGVELANNINEAGLKSMIDSIFDSSLFNQVVGSVAEPFMLKYANELTNENFTSEDLKLNDIVWKDELKSIVSVVVEMADAGMISELKDNSDDAFDTILGKSKATINALGVKMGQSKVMTSIVPKLVEPTIESSVEGLVGPGIKVIPENLDYSVEIAKLLNAAKMLYDEGILSDSTTDENKTDAVMDLLKVDANIDTLFDSEVIYSVVTKTIDKKIGEFEFDGTNIEAASTAGFTKQIWKEEIKLLVNALDDKDSVEVFTDLGKMDPAEEETATKIAPLANIVSNLLRSRIFGASIVNEMNELLELDGSSAKTQADLTSDDVIWSHELEVANKLLWNITEAPAHTTQKTVTIEDIPAFIDDTRDTVLIKELVVTKVKTGLKDVKDVNDNQLFSNEFVDGLDIYDDNNYMAVGPEYEALAAPETFAKYTYYSSPEDGQYILLGRAPADFAANYDDYYKEVAPAFVANKYYQKSGSNYVLLNSEPADWETAYKSYFEKKAINWNTEASLKDAFESVNYPGESDYHNESYTSGKDGYELTQAMITTGKTVLVKQIVDDKLMTEIEDRVEEYFYANPANPTMEEQADFEAYKNGLRIYNANYYNEFNVYDELQNLDGIDIENSASFGSAMNGVKGAIANSTIFGPVAERQVKSRLKSMLTSIDLDADSSTQTTANFVEDLDIIEMNWENELSIKDTVESDLLPLEDFEITPLNVVSVFAPGGILSKAANSVIITSMINENEFADDKKIQVDAMYETLVTGYINSLDAPDAGKAAITKIINFH